MAVIPKNKTTRTRTPKKTASPQSTSENVTISKDHLDQLLSMAGKMKSMEEQIKSMTSEQHKSEKEQFTEIADKSIYSGKLQKRYRTRSIDGVYYPVLDVKYVKKDNSKPEIYKLHGVEHDNLLAKLTLLVPDGVEVKESDMPNWSTFVKECKYSEFQEFGVVYGKDNKEVFPCETMHIKDAEKWYTNSKTGEMVKFGVKSYIFEVDGVKHNFTANAIN